MGLSKVALERHCPALNEESVKKHRGKITTVKELVSVLREEKIQKHVTTLEAILRNEHKNPDERHKFLTFMLLKKADTFSSVEVEALENVYMKLYKKLPEGYHKNG